MYYICLFLVLLLNLSIMYDHSTNLSNLKTLCCILYNIIASLSLLCFCVSMFYVICVTYLLTYFYHSAVNKICSNSMRSQEFNQMQSTNVLYYPTYVSGEIHTRQCCCAVCTTSGCHFLMRSFIFPFRYLLKKTPLQRDLKRSENNSKRL